MLFCLHTYNKVDDKGYQYCKKCGKAMFVRGNKCLHRYKVIDKYKCVNHVGGGESFLYVSRCQKCGKIIKERTD